MESEFSCACWHCIPQAPVLHVDRSHHHAWKLQEGSDACALALPMVWHWRMDLRLPAEAPCSVQTHGTRSSLLKLLRGSSCQQGLEKGAGPTSSPIAAPARHSLPACSHATHALTPAVQNLFRKQEQWKKNCSTPTLLNRFKSYILILILKQTEKVKNGA